MIHTVLNTWPFFFPLLSHTLHSKVKRPWGQLQDCLTTTPGHDQIQFPLQTFMNRQIYRGTLHGSSTSIPEHRMWCVCRGRWQSLEDDKFCEWNSLALATSLWWTVRHTEHSGRNREAPRGEQRQAPHICVQEKQGHLAFVPLRLWSKKEKNPDELLSHGFI